MSSFDPLQLASNDCSTDYATDSTKFWRKPIPWLGISTHGAQRNMRSSANGALELKNFGQYGDETRVSSR